MFGKIRTAVLFSTTMVTFALGIGSASARPVPKAWATINICDTALHPNEIGVRAQMAALKVKRGSALMRFRLQYRTEANTWQILNSTDADSGFKKVGKAAKVNQAGWTFELKPPSNSTYVVRGIVTFKWVVPGPDRIVRETTEVGHPNTVNAEPEKYSESLCTIS